jgi:quinol monooxygenase YgiN
VPLFVSVHQYVPPDRLSRVLATIRQDFATSRRVHPGRRSSRIFQHLDLPQILAIGEWASAADYQRLYQSPGYRATSVASDPPARIELLSRLAYLARMHLRPSVAGAAIITAPPETSDHVVAAITTDFRREMVAEPGIVTHEIYQAQDNRCRLLVLHTWESIDALGQLRAGLSRRHEAELARLGATFERFVGWMAAEYSSIGEPTGGEPGSAGLAPHRPRAPGQV